MGGQGRRGDRSRGAYPEGDEKTVKTSGSQQTQHPDEAGLEQGRDSVAIPQQRLERLLDVSAALLSELSLEGVLQKVVETATAVIGARYAALGVLSEDGTSLSNFVTAGIDAATHRKIGALPRGRGILGLLIRHPKVIRLPDLTRHPDSYGFPKHHPVMKSFLGVPVTGRRGVFGNLYLTEKIDAEEFTEEDARLAMLFANQVAAAVENARLHEESARLLEEVQLLHRSRERFFAMVNHELRNALAATYGWAELLVRRKDPASVPPAAYEVLDSAGQAVGLINDLLDLSRLDEDRLKPVIREVRCPLVIQRAVSRVQPAAEAKSVTLAVNIDDDVATCQTDQNRIEQILGNLLTNAIKHAPAGSTVDVTAHHGEGTIRVTVEDQGPGVREEDLETIFDIYVTSPNEEGHGAGLGLPLSRRLARLLGGDVLADARPGKGGRFHLDLPARRS